ncbi:hypothetical protein KXR63_01165 [Stutzerimonas chloritidismutans]|uniref:hypothetical protein n=1 Tax=Stutzerimonas stutzeri subgroup TaxID=578833 RepID=UPI0015CD850C|nr:hypothetical protein [Stutzerimonas kunmingensis]MBU0565584.1 hypothetical protein [Gammaproteobacteria bacterium]MBD3873935.1 hypothetical protein [Stutzerimonas kunmingensis]MBU0836039.1 hypothetical protein [Gammaproteobacteria bacterium]MBU1804747.1 hypothetical protein [Gammaproteobacteria bacterium]MBU2332020.1 hypothetical protein [Gammaproteobacteria bacterium]|tara:strand:- start:256 stop:636 length:381 start_codon:yes stop_codon:yes gene_type:complete
MSKQLFLACGLALCAPLAFAQTPPPEVVTHLNGLDVEISPMGVPAKSEGVEGELLGVRAVKVMNRTGGQITCEFHVPNDARSDTSASPVFTVAPNTQRTERVPGNYSPDEPYAEITCRSSDQSPAQ